MGETHTHTHTHTHTYTPLGLFRRDDKQVDDATVVTNIYTDFFNAVQRGIVKETHVSE